MNNFLPIEDPYDCTNVIANDIIRKTRGHFNRTCAKGVGEGEQGGTFKSGGHKWVCAPPPTFGQSKCSNFTICSYFEVKNQFFQNFLGSLRSPTLIIQYFLNFANLKL